MLKAFMRHVCLGRNVSLDALFFHIFSQSLKADNRSVNPD